jgi:sirohydrochlorin cobaltochelatase
MNHNRFPGLGSFVVLLVATALSAHSELIAQTSSVRTVPRSVGVLLVAHGADGGWNGRIDSLAAALRRDRLITGPIAVSFLMGPAAATSRFQDAVDSLVGAGARRVVVVPILVSSHSGHYEQIRYLAGATDSLDEEMIHHLHMSGITRSRAGIPITVTPALDDAPELARAVATRALALIPSPAGRALFLLGHGPNSAEDYAAWMTNLRAIADSVRTMTGFASVAVELVRDDAPAEVRAEAVKRSRELIGLQRAATGKDVVVVPLLISASDVSARKLPADLAGLPVIYGGEPLLPHEAIVRVAERRVLEMISPTP